MKNTKDEVLNKKPEVVTEKNSAALKGEGQLFTKYSTKF